MASNPVQQRMNRAIGGTIHELLSEKAEIELKGVYDPEPFLLIKELQERNTKRNGKRVELVRKILSEARKKLLVKQYSMILNSVNEDTTVLSLISGHQTGDYKDPMQEALEG